MEADMTTSAELLTPAEAAVIAGVTVRDINRVIDERILPEGFYTSDTARRLSVIASPFVRFYFLAAHALTAEERSRLISRLSEKLSPKIARWPIAHWRRHSRPEDWTISDGFLTVSLWEFATEAEERHAKLTEARSMVVEDPEILGGMPVIRGTRIPVYDVAASLAADFPIERIREAYPTLDDRQIELAGLYAEATPPRGRPRRLPAFLRKAKVISDIKVPRRRHA
jgi:uncharacterized protein (DUF433 family)